jgi:hypothetical protein
MAVRSGEVGTENNARSGSDRTWVYLGSNPPPIDPNNQEQIREVIEEFLDAFRGLTDEQLKQWDEEVSKRRVVVYDPENYPPETIIMIKGQPTVEVGVITDLAFQRVEKKRLLLEEEKRNKSK